MFSLLIARSIIEKSIHPIEKNAIRDGRSLKKIKPTIVAATGSMDAIIDALTV